MRIALDEVLAQQKILLLDGSMSAPLEAMGCDLNDLLWTARALADADLLALETMPSLDAGRRRGGGRLLPNGGQSHPPGGTVQRGLFEAWMVNDESRF